MKIKITMSHLSNSLIVLNKTKEREDEIDFDFLIDYGRFPDSRHKVRLTSCACGQKI